MKREPIVATGHIELHLIGQHDQSSHGRGGGGGGGRDASARAGIKKLEESRGLRAIEVLEEAEPAGIKERVKPNPALDKAEKDAEEKRNAARTELENSKGLVQQIKTYNKYADAENELLEVRKSIYTTSDLERITEADNYSHQLKKLSTDRTIGEFDRGVYGRSAPYWESEVSNTKKEARGQEPDRFDQKLGDTFNKKAGEWPVRDAQPPRQIDKIVDAGGLFRSETVDGIKVKRVYEITAADGQKIRMYDRKGGKEKGNAELMNSVAAMHELYPQTPPTRLVVMSRGQTIRMAGANYGGFVFPGDNHIFLNKNELPAFKRSAKAGWTMPAGKTADPGHYVTTHEFGHQYDANNRRGAGRGLFQNSFVKRHLSDYGKTVPEEGYAEAFAEWHVSQGKTTNPAAIAYARHEKWYGNDRIGEVPLTSSGIMLVSDEWDPWYMAEELGIITFQEEEDVEEEEVFKYAPMIIETWDPNKKSGPLNYAGVGEPTKAEIKEADKIVREVAKLLGLEL